MLTLHWGVKTQGSKREGLGMKTPVTKSCGQSASLQNSYIETLVPKAKVQ